MNEPIHRGDSTLTVLVCLGNLLAVRVRMRDTSSGGIDSVCPTVVCEDNNTSGGGRLEKNVAESGERVGEVRGNTVRLESKSWSQI